MTRERTSSELPQWAGPQPTLEALQTAPSGFRLSQQNVKFTRILDDLALDHLANVGSSGCMKVKADGICAEGSAVGPRVRRPCNFAFGTKYAPSALRFVRLVPHARAGR